MTAPRIYVACLASYNAGILHGKWIEATADADAMSAEIWDMLAKSPEPNVTRQKFVCADCGESRTITLSDFRETVAPECDECGEAMKPEGKPFPSAEEWAIHDYEGLGPDLGEYAGLAEVAKRVALIDEAEDIGIPVSVLLEFARDFASEGDDADDIAEKARDAYRCRLDDNGEARTWAELAEELEEETGGLDEVPERFRNYIDFEAMGRDLRLNGDFSAYECDGEIFFFWSH